MVEPETYKDRGNRLRKILAAPVRVYNDGSFGINGGGIQWQRETKKLLLYWPKVIIPQILDNVTFNQFSSFDSPTLHYLRDQRQIETIVFETKPDDPPDLSGIVERTRDYLNNLCSLQTGFAIFQCPTEPDKLSDYISNLVGNDTTRVASAVSVQVSLIDILPMAPPSATFQDLIDFKRKRAAEFSEFRAMVDRLSYTFSSVGDLEEGARLAANEARSALADLDRLTLEKWPNRLLGSITTSLGNFSKNMLAGAAVGSVFEEPLHGAFIGAASGAIVAFADNALKGARFDQTTKPFAYCLHAKNL